MQVLVVDIGGSHVKLSVGEADEPVKITSGPDFTPERLMSALPNALHDRPYDVVSIGYPGKVDAHGPVEEPGNLGDGWVGFDFAAAFKHPVRVANDAVMQALGAYEDGRMLLDWAPGSARPSWRSAWSCRSSWATSPGTPDTR